MNAYPMDDVFLTRTGVLWIMSYGRNVKSLMFLPIKSSVNLYQKLKYFDLCWFVLEMYVVHSLYSHLH